MEEKKVVIVDIDGTISKVGDRLKYLQQSPKDWDAFYDACFDDEPIEEVIQLVRTLAMRYEIVFCTGRRESVRNQTKNWLQKHMGVYFAHGCTLLMRPNNDYRHDTEVKVQLFLGHRKLKDVLLVLEDRNSMVAKWRSLGLKCLQVAEGDF